MLAEGHFLLFPTHKYTSDFLFSNRKELKPVVIHHIPCWDLHYI